jgi:hypothetical protein
MKEYEINEMKQNAISLLSKTDRIYCILRSVTKSGTCRSISFHVVDNNKNILNINYYISVIVGYKFNKARDGLVVKGCNMDMGFHVVHTLLRELGISEKISHRWL